MTHASGSQVKRHPIRGFLGGLLAGIGLSLLLITYGKAPFGTATLWVPVVILLVVGLLVGLFAPPLGARASGRSRQSAPPTAPSGATAEPPAAPANEAAATDAGDTGEAEPPAPA